MYDSADKAPAGSVCLFELSVCQATFTLLPEFAEPIERWLTNVQQSALELHSYASVAVGIEL